MLIHGGSSGIGTTAIMLAKCHGARVIVTVGSEEKAEACRKLGADVAINYNTQDFVAETKKATGGKGAELIVDMVAGDYIQKNYEAAAMDGRIVQIAFQRPPKAMVDFRPILMKRLWHTGSGLRPRPVHEKAAIARAVEENVWPLIAAGKVKPVIYKTFPLREAAAAHALMESSQHIGKIVLTTTDRRNSRRAAITKPPRTAALVRPQTTTGCASLRDLSRTSRSIAVRASRSIARAAAVRDRLAHAAVRQLALCARSRSCSRFRSR